MSLPEQVGSADARGQLLSAHDWRTAVLHAVAGGARFAGLYGTSDNGHGCIVSAVLANEGRVDLLRTLLSPDDKGVLEYRSLSPKVPAAFWYERALHDLSGVVPRGHPRLDPLLMPREQDSPAPLPGAPPQSRPTAAGPGLELPGPVDLAGVGMFTLPLGPVRSGVFESIEFLIETPGEDIPHLNVRPHYKHRGIAKQFEGRTVSDAVLVAERVEGISSVAHAIAFCEAIETLSAVQVPQQAQFVRVLHAELERVANHLDVTMKLADAAGLAVATSRFAWHKETVMRLVSELSGNRFGRGVITPGGVNHVPSVKADGARFAVENLATKIGSDLASLQASASFLDRIRGTGPLNVELARRHGALGPIGRGSGVDTDVRRDRPYAGYASLGPVPVALESAGDALARSRVRWREIEISLDLVSRVLEGLREIPDGAAAVRLPSVSGLGIGSSESAQGEVLHAVELEAGVVRRAFARSASFHNLVLLHDVFAGDIFTDLPFIEASFGLGYAGVAM